MALYFLQIILCLRGKTSTKKQQKTFIWVENLECTIQISNFEKQKASHSDIKPFQFVKYEGYIYDKYPNKYDNVTFLYKNVKFIWNNLAWKWNMSLSVCDIVVNENSLDARLQR